MHQEILYVITPVFNPRRFKSRYKLYTDFADYMASTGAQLLTVEIAFAGRPFEVTDKENPWHLQLHTHDELWHKERAINLGIQKLLQLVPHAKYIAWIDADVKFSNHHWVREAIEALKHYQVIQLFSEAQNLDPKHQMMWSCPGLFKNFVNLGFHQDPPVPLEYVSKGHPGLAWAARRETLEQLGGLMDFCITGSGDTYMANALMGNVHLSGSDNISQGYFDALDRWGKRAKQYVNENVGYIDGICFHYWHGKSEERGYEKRMDIVRFHGFNPNTDIYFALNGLYKFAGNKPKMVNDIRLSQTARNEDSTELPQWYNK